MKCMTYANNQDIFEFGHDCVKRGGTIEGRGVTLKSEGFRAEAGPMQIGLRGKGEKIVDWNG